MNHIYIYSTSHTISPLNHCRSRGEARVPSFGESQSQVCHAGLRIKILRKGIEIGLQYGVQGSVRLHRVQDVVLDFVTRLIHST